MPGSSSAVWVSGPFEESVGEDPAAAVPEGVPEGGLAVRGLRAGVDEGADGVGSGGPVRDQPPAQRPRPELVPVSYDGEDGLGGGDVEARVVIGGQGIDPELGDQAVDIDTEGKPPAHASVSR